MEADIATARKAVAMVTAAPGHGMHRDDLAAVMGMPWKQLWPSLGLAYAQGAIDFCRDYVVASASRRTRARVTAIATASRRTR